MKNDIVLQLILLDGLGKYRQGIYWYRMLNICCYKTLFFHSQQYWLFISACDMKEWFERNIFFIVVGWLVVLFYGESTLFRSFNAELNFKQFRSAEA